MLFVAIWGRFSFWVGSTIPDTATSAWGSDVDDYHSILVEGKFFEKLDLLADSNGAVEVEVMRTRFILLMSLLSSTK